MGTDGCQIDAVPFTDVTSEIQQLYADDQEQSVAHDVALHDAQLMLLQLQGLLQRYREKPPRSEELAERHETDIDELTAEAQQLREENSVLALQSQSELPATSSSAARSSS